MPTFPEARAAEHERIRREERHYRGGKHGNLSQRKCVGGCGLKLPTALVALGITAHPTCGRDVADLMAAAR